MNSFVETVGEDGNGYGLGYISQDFPNLGRGFGHSGDLYAYNSDMWYFPDTEVLFVGLQNNRRLNNFPLLALNSLIKEELQKDRTSIPESNIVIGLILFSSFVLLLRRKRSNSAERAKTLKIEAKIAL